VNADIARSWILANLIAATVSAVFGLFDYAIRSALDSYDAATTFGAVAIYTCIAAVIGALSLAFYARLTGAVLVWMLPALPQRLWLALHLTMGAAIGLCLGLAALIPTSGDKGPLELRDTAEFVFLFSVFAAGGGLLGAGLGGSQAMVLRRAAHPTGLWVATSSLGGAILGVALVVYLLLVDLEQPLMRDLALVGTFVAVGIVSAIIMLPAVLRLRPR
jgi:hypothetical protein